MPPEASIQRRVFVVGVPRSGTTLVQSLLAAHRSATSFTESHFFSRLFTHLPGLSTPLLTRDPAPRLRDFLAENDECPPPAAAWFASRRRWTLRAKPLRPFQTRPVARRLLQVLDELTLRRGRSTWIEKTPRHLRYVPFIEGLLGPDDAPCFVHVIRNGVDTVASLRRASRGWEHPYDLDACVRRWNADVGFSLGRVGAPNDLFVFYDELTSRPEATLRSMLLGLDLEWEPEILERYGPAADRLVTGEEEWKTGISRAIRPSATSGETLSAEERYRVTLALRQDLYQKLLESVGPTPGKADAAG